MTPQERAEKIFNDFADIELVGSNVYTRFVNTMAAQIEEAVSEAAEEAVAFHNKDCREGGEPHWHTCPVLKKQIDSDIEEAVLEAFADERLEEAAKMAERNMCGLDICGVETSSKIRALKSSEGKQ